MKVKFIKGHPKYAYFAGDEADIKDPEELIKGKFVEPVIQEKESKEEYKQQFKGKKK